MINSHGEYDSMIGLGELGALGAQGALGALGSLGAMGAVGAGLAEISVTKNVTKYIYWSMVDL